MAVKKCYAVKVGRAPGVYDTWDECKEQVSGFKGAVYKGFSDRAEAEEFLATDEPEKNQDGVTVGVDSRSLFDGIDGPIAYVDGSYDKESGQYAYGCVMIPDAKHLENEVHLSGKGSDPSIASMNNVAGEIQGSMAAMRYARDHGYEKLTIFHDYNGIAKWCEPDPKTGRTWKANEDGTKRYKEFYDDISQTVDISFVKVKGHSGDYYNDIVDGLAKRELGVPVMKRVAEKLQPKTEPSDRGHEFDGLLLSGDEQGVHEYSPV